MSDDFFDDFPEGIEVDWSKISDKELDQLIATLSKQDVEKIFNELRTVIDTNNKRKSIVSVTLKILQVAVSLGMKIV
jgi:arsenate reductase-like glutaredoxin family protein